MTQPTRRALAIASVAWLPLLSWASAQTPAELQDGGLQSAKAARVFGEIVDAPDKGIPEDLLAKAECVAVFPSVIKALGGDASVAGGPVGRQAGAATDVKLDAQILSYSRSRGLFAGLELAGVVIKPDVDDMRDIYGAGVTAKSVLQDAARSTPMAVQAFPAALGRYSSR